MKLIIHDLTKEEFQEQFPNADKDTHIVFDTGCIQCCIGCFGCWIKTPGKCLLNDGYENMGMLLSQAEEVNIISKCCYGGYSPFIKNVLDRSISYLLPFFKRKNHETHHKQRYRKTFRLSVCFYGEHITKQEMDTARRLVKANSINFYASQFQVRFCKSPKYLRQEGKLQ